MAREPRRRHFTRTLLAIQIGALAGLAIVAAAVVTKASRDVHHLAAGGSAVWWDTRAATMAAILAGLGLYLLVSFILPARHREGVRR